MPQFSLKPVFIGWSTLVAQFPFQLFFSFWSGGFFGGMSTMLFPAGKTFPVSRFEIIGGAMFFIFPIAVYTTKYLNYRQTEYKFFEDRIEFEEGFFTINKKVIKYKDVREVNLRRGILQRANGLGTVYLATMATGSTPYSNPFSALGFGNTSASGISVRDVIEPEQQYEKIRSLVETINR